MHTQLPPRRLGAALLFLILSIGAVTGQTLSQETSSRNGSIKEDPDPTEREQGQDSVKNVPRDNVSSRVDFKRWGLSLHGGITIPHGNFNNVFNPGPNGGVDVEYRFNQRFSAEGIYTYNRFRGETFGPITIPDMNLHVFSINGKVYGSSSPVRPFFNFGAGAYKFDPGPTRGGLNAGGGLQFDVSPTVAIDAMYNFHNVFTSGSNTRFSTAQGGVRFRF